MIFMYISGNFNTRDKLFQLFKQNIMLFNSFESVYLFGSILGNKKSPNDIDLLLIYTEFSSKVSNELDIINAVFNNLDELAIDITVLSVEEEKETKFIKRLNLNYLRLK